MATAVATKNGQITQVVGVVVDAEFEKGHLPAIYDALEIKRDDGILVLEVAQHLSQTAVRAIALSSTDGLARGDEVIATGAPISVPGSAWIAARLSRPTRAPAKSPARSPAAT